MLELLANAVDGSAFTAEQTGVKERGARQGHAGADVGRLPANAQASLSTAAPDKHLGSYWLLSGLY